MKKEELNELINSYGDHNSTLNALKKTCGEENDRIKAYMLESELGALESDLYALSLTNRESISFDEDRLLDVLKSDWANRYGNVPCPYIKSREYIDMDVLESVMFNGELPSDVLADMNKCKLVKTTPTLRVKKLGGKK